MECSFVTVRVADAQGTVARHRLLRGRQRTAPLPVRREAPGQVQNRRCQLRLLTRITAIKACATVLQRAALTF
jgi:hypothetical protein